MSEYLIRNLMNLLVQKQRYLFMKVSRWHRRMNSLSLTTYAVSNEVKISIK